MPDENGRKEYGKKPDSGGDSFILLSSVCDSSITQDHLSRQALFFSCGGEIVPPDLNAYCIVHDICVRCASAKRRRSGPYD